MFSYFFFFPLFLPFRSRGGFRRKRLRSSRLEWSPIPTGSNEAPSQPIGTKLHPNWMERGSVPTDWNGAPFQLVGVRIFSNRLRRSPIPNGSQWLERGSIAADYTGIPFRLVATRLQVQPIGTNIHPNRNWVKRDSTWTVYSEALMQRSSIPTD